MLDSGEEGRDDGLALAASMAPGGGGGRAGDGVIKR